MKVFLFILIVFSGLQISGYALVDVLLLGMFFFLIVIVNRNSLKIKFDAILFFCIYILLQVIRGMYVLNDYRMIYWLYFFVIVYFSHQYLVDLFRKSRIDHHFVEMIFNYSLVYFIIYGLLGVIVSNPDDFQGIFWIGSSGAFLVVIPLVCSHFYIFHNSGYSIAKLKLPSMMLYLVTAVVHQSRTGMYIFFIYLIFLVFQATAVNPKKLGLMVCVIALTLFTWDATRDTFYTNSGSTGDAEMLMAQSMLDESSGLEDQADIDRILMVISIYNKFVSSPVELLIGSGWYTSRETLKPFEMQIRSRYGLSSDHMQGDTPLQVTSLAAIVSDTGLVGLLFILYFFFKSARQILQTQAPGRIILLLFLMLNWLFFLVAYSFTNVLGFLLFLPNGILVSLARVNSPSNQLVK